MAEEIRAGNLVRHKANLGGILVVVQVKDSGHGWMEYTCRWYNDKSGSYELEKFYDSELIAVKKD